MASRRCFGIGCSGFAYCFNCWEASHPEHDGELRAHGECLHRVPVSRSSCQMAKYCSDTGCEDISTCKQGAAADGVLWDDSSGYPTLCLGCAVKWTEGALALDVMQPGTSETTILPMHVKLGKGTAKRLLTSAGDGAKWQFYLFASAKEVSEAERDATTATKI